MRTILALCLLLGSAHAEKLTAEEATAATIAQLQAQIAKLGAELQWCEVRRKHNIGDDDEIDQKTLEITRKPKAKK